MDNTATSQSALVLQYYKQHPKEPLKHGQVVDWVTKLWLETHSTPPRDLWRAVRKLYEQGLLVKVQKGVYMYDPDHIVSRNLEDFTVEQKNAIFDRDGHRCVICGRGWADGVELTVDHIKPKSLGGKAEITNGQTLCTQHNLRKKNYGQTETGKKLFIRLYELAEKENDQELMSFCADVLDVYDKHKINGHIEWKR